LVAKARVTKGRIDVDTVRDKLSGGAGPCGFVWTEIRIIT
jgi:hypothetical protein